MLSGFARSTRGSASAFDQRSTNVGTLASSSEPTVHSSQTGCLGPIQTMVDILVCGPPPGSHGFTHSQKVAHQFLTSDTSLKRGVRHQRLLSKGHLHKDSNAFTNEHQQRQSSKSSVKRSPTTSSQNNSSKKACPERDSPLLFELLTKNSQKHMSVSSQKSEGTSQQMVDSSGNSSQSHRTLGGKPFLDDDQILLLIAEKLSKFRAEMKALKEKEQEKTDTDSLNCTKLKSNCGPQATACSSDASTLGKALQTQQDNKNGTKDKGASSSSKQDSERSKVKGNGSSYASAKHSSEYARIMQDAAAICTKKEEESQLVLTSLSGVTLDELIKKNPNLTLNYKPSNEEYKSQWRNVKSVDIDKESDLGIRKVLKERENTIKEVDNGLKLAESSKFIQGSVPVSSALNTCENQPPEAKEKPFGNLTVHSNQESNVAQIHISDGKSLPSSRSEGLTHERNWQQPIEQMEIQVGLSKGEELLSDRMGQSSSLPKYPQYDEEESHLTAQLCKHGVSSRYDDISDDERQVAGIMSEQKVTAEPTKQVEDNVNACTASEPEQESHCTTQCPNMNTSTEYENISDDENTVLGKMFEQKAIHEPNEHMTDDENGDTVANNLEQQAATDVPKQQYLEMQLNCSCPYYVETEEGFEQQVCPKCIKEISLRQGKPQSVARKDESLASFDLQSKADTDNQQDHSDSDDDWLVIPITASDVNLEQEIIVLDDFESDEVENENVQSPEQCEKPNSPCFQKIQEFDTLESFMQVKLKQLNKNFAGGSASPSPSRDQVAYDKTTSERESASCSGSDNYETEDSCDYPSQSKHNHLTVSSQILPPLSHELDSTSRAEDNDVPSERNNSSLFTESATDTEKVDRSKFFPDMSTDDEEESNDSSNNQVIAGSTSQARPPKEPSQERISSKLEESKLSKKRRFKKRSFSSVAGDASCQQKRTAMTEKTTKTASTSDHDGTQKAKIKRKRPWFGINDNDSYGKNSDINKNVSKPMTQNGKLFSRPLSLPSQGVPVNSISTTRPSEAKGLPLSRTLSVDGESYEASSLPAYTSSKPQKYSISKPNQVNSYSTASSTPAKQQLVKDWESQHVPTRAEKRNSFERDPSAPTVPVKIAKKKDHEIIREAVPGPSYEPTSRQRHNSQEPQTRLMKKTKLLAQQLTQARNSQAPIKQSRAVGEGYKWSEKPPMAKPMTG